jgi:ubiquinone/menaquinone biosynthesis C-methylase UbiE
MGIFRKAPGEPLAVTMTGVKLGNRLLSIGVRDPKLIAALSMKAGVTGRACVVEADAARAAGAADAIEREGGLVEASEARGWTMSFAADSFDVAVARDVFSTLTADDTRQAASETLRVLRGGGRLIVIESAKRVRGDALTAPLTVAGFAAVRVLAEAEGMIFVEGIKKA